MLEIAIGFILGSLLASYSEHYRGLFRQLWGFLAGHTTNNKRRKVRVVRPTKARAKAK